MRKQFYLQDWLKDKSQKVETRDGRPVRIVCWDRKDAYPIVALATEANGNESYINCYSDGRKTIHSQEFLSDLFIVTPEEELTPFEKKVADIIDLWYEDYVQWSTPGASAHNYPDQQIKTGASELFALAIDARAKELSNGLKQSKLDKDSIPYHLIEFMCNLYTCQNWKEIEDTAELYVTRIKAAALKDLPRWKKCQEDAPCACVYNCAKREDSLLYYNGHTLRLIDLEKLPGFKED